MTPTRTIVSLALLTTALAGCQTAMRPQMTPIQDSLSQSQHEQIATPVIIPEEAKPAPGSLWRPGAKQFFKDSRASEVGDIVTILVSETAEAETTANTETTREVDQNSDVGNLMNLDGLLRSRHIIDPITSNLLSTDSNRTFTGEGSTDRSDTLTATIAAVVTQVLPNGYLVIQGKREVVINYELQELQVRGIVRPEDITADNTVASNKVAEARIFYAGRGLIDETQTPQYGVRFMDKVLPF